MADLAREERERLREAIASGSPLPWFFDSYSGIFSQPLVKEYDRIAEIEPERPDDEFPEPRVASVPRRSGDTATVQGALDAVLIERAVNAAPVLLDQLAEAERERDEARARVVNLECERDQLNRARSDAADRERDARADLAAARKDRDEALRAFGNLVAVINRDGGHQQGEWEAQGRTLDEIGLAAQDVVCKERGALDAALYALKATIARLAEHAEGHLWECSREDTHGEAPCDCGYEEARAFLAGTEG